MGQEVRSSGQPATTPETDERSAESRRARLLPAPHNYVLEMLATGRSLPEVLEALLHDIEEHCAGALGSVMLLDHAGKRLLHGAAPSLPSEFNAAVDGMPVGPNAGSCGTAAWKGERVVVEDVQTDPLCTEYRNLARTHGLRACWAQPIVSSQNRVLGTLGLYYREPRGPGSRDLEWIEMAAHVAGVAIELISAALHQEATEQRLREHSAALAELAKSEELGSGDFLAFIRRATATAARVLGVERVSVWLFGSDRSCLRCEDLFELGEDRHSDGIELEAVKYPIYFAALARGRTIAAHDALNDPDTAEFSEGYLGPLGIGSMLDATVRHAGALAGVVCHEHVGPMRTWEADEQDFAASVADFVSLALESRERIRAEYAVRQAQAQLLAQQQEARQRVEEELEKAKERLVRHTRLAAIGQLAASVAHELRNPLGAIRNAEYFLRRQFRQDDPKWATHMGVIEQEVEAADRIINNLLDLSRAQEPAREAVDLAQAVQDGLGYVKGAEGVRVDLDLDPDPFEVWASPTQLRQLLSNLITNSVQSLQGVGRIHVTAHREPGFDIITLRDDGQGIPAESRDKVFEPLFSTKVKGTGLGLAICRQIVQQHGGSLELVEMEERGATFRIRLPRSPE